MAIVRTEDCALSTEHFHAARLPRTVCLPRDFGDLLAEEGSDPWASLPALELCDTVTGGPPKQATTLKLGWTPDALHLLFHCTDELPWATMTTRDAPLYEEEVVEVFFDPVGDLAAYFEIEVNPRGAVLDLILRRSRSGYVKDLAWDCDGLRASAQIGEGFWTAALAIPFQAVVAEPPVPGALWRANFFRIDRPPGVPRELSAWSPTGHALFHVPDRFGIIEFG
ncbi:MAG: hypothetical protein QOE70_2623 [Chthoniobacter sp.]|jgi:hypothetical protein|nr:hypothetical protein [Chthoniobacter sp.]